MPAGRRGDRLKIPRFVPALAGSDRPRPASTAAPAGPARGARPYTGRVSLPRRPASPPSDSATGRPPGPARAAGGRRRRRARGHPARPLRRVGSDHGRPGDRAAERPHRARQGGPERTGRQLQRLVPGRVAQRAHGNHRGVPPPRAHALQGHAAVPARRDRPDPVPQRRRLQREHLLRLDELLRDDRRRPARSRDAHRGRPDGEQPDRQGGPGRRDDRGAERAGGRREQPRTAPVAGRGVGGLPGPSLQLAGDRLAERRRERVPGRHLPVLPDALRPRQRGRGRRR